ncbi:MAG: type I restriction enzyme HsdR N-terminal domain-containing protein [Muribaculaceae bacterium]|nr:type I restriction enzyme HsdR N-terminal domain-containing protein [Muribaculaceae bacterium]
MCRLNLPPFPMNLRRNAGGDTLIYDRLRRRFVVLTPEEWVRQHFTAYLMQLGYPQSLMANEVGLSLNGTRRRCDTVVWDNHGQPAVIVEYKAPSVAISQPVFDQIVRYNMVLQARLLMVSNGMRHFCCEIDHLSGSYRFMHEIPAYGYIAATVDQKK